MVAILYRDPDNEPDIGLLATPLVILNASTTLLYPLLYPPANTAYYLLLESSFIVVAANLSRAVILVIVFVSIVYGIPTQKASITTE